MDLSLNKIIIFFVLSFSFYTAGQTYSSYVSDSTIISFMDWELNHGERYDENEHEHGRRNVLIKISKYDISNFILSDSAFVSYEQKVNNVFNQINKSDTIIGNAEKISLINQLKKVKDTVWSHKFSSVNWKKKKRKNFYMYSIPLFINSNHVLIKKSFYCGNVCAYGGIYLYKKTSSVNWELITIINGWLS